MPIDWFKNCRARKEHPLQQIRKELLSLWQRVKIGTPPNVGPDKKEALIATNIRLIWDQLIWDIRDREERELEQEEKEAAARRRDKQKSRT